MRARRLPWNAYLVLFVVCILTAVGIPADRAQADPSCPEGTICFWTENDFRGDKLVYLNPQPNPGRCTRLTKPSLSAKNATSRPVVLLRSDSKCDKEISNPSLGILGPDDEAREISPPATSFSLV